MKLAKKLISLSLSIMMVAVLGVAALAAGTGSITIKNAVVGKNYVAYKVFDASYSSSDPNAASYYIDSSSPWYNLVKDAKDSDSNALFSIVDTPNPTIKLVEKKNTDPSAYITWFKSEEVKTALEDTTKFVGISIEATGTTVKFENLEFGYYYITSELGSEVTITNVKSDVTLFDKAMTPGWGVDGGKYIVKNNTLVDKDTAEIGEKIVYKIIVNNAYNPYKGAPITEYVINDIVGSAINIDFHSMKIEINGSDVPNGWIQGIDSEHKYSHAVDKNDSTTNATNYKWRSINASEDDNEFSINIKWSENDTFFYEGAPNVIEITYEGELAGNASLGLDTANNTNKAQLSWKTASGTGKDQQDYIVAHNSLAIGFVKVDSTDSTKFLAGAEFELRDSAGNTILLYASKNTPNVYYVKNAYTESHDTFTWDTVTPYSKIVTDTDSGSNADDFMIAFVGLKEGSYKLVETKAPDGYNLVANGTAIELNVSNSTGVINKSGHNVAAFTLTIENGKGSILPETGGTGTIIFIVVGAVAVIGAGLFLVTNKRMAKEGI